MSLKLNKYLIDLRRNVNRLERIDINGEEDNSFSGKYLKRIICSVVSIAFVYLLKNGFTQNFVSYSSTVLSILIGLFITAMIFSFDKFYQYTDKDNASSKEKLWDTQSYNYSKQFAYLTGYNIVLCVFALVALSFSTLFENGMNVNLLEYSFNFHEITIGSILIFLKLSFVLLQRFYVLYWMLSVMYNTLFIVSSMIKFMTVKIDRKQ